MTFTDPPYNVNYASSKQKLRGKNRPIMNDALGDGFGALLYEACINILTVTKGAVYMCMSSSELDTLQMRRVLAAYSAYYNKTRTHLSLEKNAPLGRAIQRHGAIVTVPILSGLHHCYSRI